MRYKSTKITKNTKTKKPDTNILGIFGGLRQQLKNHKCNTLLHGNLRERNLNSPFVFITNTCPLLQHVVMKLEKKPN